MIFHDKFKFKQYISTNTVLLKVLEGKIQTGRLTVLIKTQERNNVTPAKLKMGQTHLHTQTQNTPLQPPIPIK